MIGNKETLLICKKTVQNSGHCQQNEGKNKQTYEFERNK